MNHYANPKLTHNAQKLRKNMTKEEKHLWYDFLKILPYRFYRQKVIGRYIVDFYCAECRIVIELDGSQHYEDENKQKDIERDVFLNKMGFSVLRYTNLEIHKNFKGVCKDILTHLTDTSSVTS